MLQWHFSALIPVVVFFSLVWFSSSRTIVWLSQSLVSAILFFLLFVFAPFESEWFPKISKNLNLNSKLRRHSFSVNLICSFSRWYFRGTSCIFVLAFATIFAHDWCQQYPFMYKCNSTLNTLSSIANQIDREFTFSYAILLTIRVTSTANNTILYLHNNTYNSYNTCYLHC